MNHINYFGFDPLVKTNPLRESVAAEDVQISRIRDECDGTNAAGKVICLVQVSNCLLLQCIKCIRRGAVHCSLLIPVSSLARWVAARCCPTTSTPTLCNIFTHPSVPNLVCFGFQPWKLTIEVPSTSGGEQVECFSQTRSQILKLNQIYFWTPSLIELWN